MIKKYVLANNSSKKMGLNQILLVEQINVKLIKFLVYNVKIQLIRYINKYSC